MAIDIKTDWLIEQVSFVEVEAAHMVEIRETGEVRPFGYMNWVWKDLLEKRQPGDELWSYSSPADTWQHLAGRAGYALVRNSTIVDQITTVMN